MGKSKNSSFKKIKWKSGKSLLIISSSLVIMVVLLTVISFFRPTIVKKEQEAQVGPPPLVEKNEFVAKIAPAAVKYGSEYGVLPSITIAQAVLESDWGNSQLASQYHNLFGVKDDDPNKSIELETTEYINGSWQIVLARFRTYESADESIKAHAQLLANGTSWNKKQYEHVIMSDNYVDAAHGLLRDGYATDPNYTDKIIEIIETNDLYRYDTK